MANTYTQLFIHATFAVRSRENVITKDWRDRLHEYISGILQNEGALPLAVGGWQDHVHVFFALPPAKSVSDIIRIVKTNSSKWINDQKFVQGKFQWQDGYGAFTNSRAEMDRVIKYIMNQEEHHSRKNFKSEFLETLHKREIIYDEKYLFEFYE